MHSLELSDNITAMENPRWLRLITIGLVLAAIAVGYFLFTSRFSSNVPIKSKSEVGQLVPSATPSARLVSTNPSPSSISAYNRITERTTKGGQPIQSLPGTGFPVELAGVLAFSVMISGWGLRRFPH